MNDYNMLSGNIVSCNAKLGGIDPSQNVREQLQAAASGALELKLMHKGKSTKVTVENAMYVPGIEVTLVSERDLGEAGFDVRKRDRGRTVSIERGNKVVGKYKSNREKHNGLYVIDDYVKDEDRSPRFNWEKIEEVLEEDASRSELVIPDKVGKRTHFLCSDICLRKGSGHIWGTEKCCLANSFHTGINVATLYHQRLGHVSLKSPKLHKRLCEALRESYKSTSKLVSHCEGCVY